MAEEVFKNTFAPEIDGDTIRVGMVIAGLRHGTIREDDLPAEVHDAVAAELERRERELISPERAVILLIGAMGEVRGASLLHKCAFLVDVEMYSRESRDIYTMFGWKPHRHGPHSEWFGRYVDEAVRDGLVEEFPALQQDFGDSAGYRLTGTGKKEFAALLEVFTNDVKKIREIMAKAAPGQSLDRLTSYIYKHYPEHAHKNVIWNRVGVDSEKACLPRDFAVRMK
ncbi:MAG: hypothetical protein OXU85_07705 [Thaumarchaeota archaeon]|nr:hypothetical protein [Nitrososphaerota archaeon]